MTLVLVTGVEGILGLGPAIFLARGALAALPAGQPMDRLGRIPVLAGAASRGSPAACVTALGCGVDAAVVVTRLRARRRSQRTILLARAAAADMYPPERRARGISLVLFGAVFGAALGPLVFGRSSRARISTREALVVPWLAAGGIMVVALVLVLLVRPDPRDDRHARIDAAAPARGRRRSARSSAAPACLPALVGRDRELRGAWSR